MEKLKMESADLTEQNIDKIAALFPNVITETKDANGKLKRAINFTLLQQMLQGDLVDGDECYEFTWVGKKQSIIDGNTPIRKTLRPCPEESKDWDKTENLYIEGDNLEVLKLLQGSYLNAVKMIYIDPPYNTGKDFVYRDNFATTKDDYEEDLGIFDDDENRLFQNNNSNGRFHSDWCSMMYPRLQLAQNLLDDNGVIFISIDDNEVSNLKKICDEVFGESNFVANFLWKKKSTTSNVEGAEVSSLLDSTLCYKKTNLAKIKPRIKLKESRSYPYKDKEGDYRLAVIEKKDSGSYKRDTMKFEIIGHAPRQGKRWQIGSDTAKLLEMKNRFIFDGEKIQLKIYDFEDKDTTSAQPNLLENHGTSDSASQAINQGIFSIPELFDNPKPVELLTHLINITVNKESDIVLDFFSGSATTAHAVLQLNAEDGGNRKFIMVQLPEACHETSEAYKAGYRNICEIGKERIRRAAIKIKEDVGLNGQNLDTGFRVFKLDSTNMKDVYYGAGEYSQQLLLDLESNIKNDRTDLDLLYGVLLDWGVSLALPHTNETIGGIKVHFVNGVDLVACFADNVNETVIREIAKRKPLRVVFRDSSFANSPDKINVTEIFKTISPETTVKVI